MAPASADDLIAQWLQQDEVSGQTEEVRPDLNAITDEQWREMFAIGREQPDAFAHLLVEHGSKSQTDTFLIWLAILTAALALPVGVFRNWTEALEKWGPRRVQAELSERSLGSSACINVGGTRDVVVGFIRDWLAWREQHQFNWTMWGVISGFVLGICCRAGSRLIPSRSQNQAARVSGSGKREQPRR